MAQTTSFNSIQRHLLQMFEYIPSEEMLEEVRSVLLAYYANKVQHDIDKIWEERNLNEKDIDDILNKHMRTPYAHGK